MSACNHTTTVPSPRTGQSYCADCGVAVLPPRPVHGADYYKRLEDARTSRWRDVGDMPPIDLPYYAAWQLPAGDASGARWVVLRVTPGQPLPKPATHWVEDLLGLPLV